MSFTVYKSSAGSGKTFTLVKEYLKLVLVEPKLYRHILAITFTNMAAGEMKQRIVDSLSAIAQQPGDGLKGATGIMLERIVAETGMQEQLVRENAADALSLILHNYNEFAVSTIDSFVHRVIRSFSFDLRLPVNFEVVMETEDVLRKAVDILISRVGHDKDLTSLLVAFVQSKADGEKSWRIENDLFKVAKELLNEDSQVHIRKLQHLTIEQFRGINRNIISFRLQVEKQWQETADTARNLIESRGIPVEAFFQGARGIAAWFGNVASGRFDKIEPNKNVLKTIEEDKWYAGKADASAKSAIDEISNELRNVFDHLHESIEKNYARYVLMGEIAKNLYPLAILNEIDNIVREYNSENSLLLISEFNRRVADIALNEPVPFIYERLGEKYRHFMVDEFQDTSIMQWQNMLPLIENSLGESQFTMVVGDAKQAIYRFRNGEVEQFVALPKVCKNPDKPHTRAREQALIRNYNGLKLDKNFRSRVAVIDFNNDFFETISDVLEPAYRDIYEDVRQLADQSKTGGFVEITLHDKAGEDADTMQFNMDNILRIIHESEMKGYAFQDVAILCRNNRNASFIAGELLRQGIKVVSSESLLLSNSGQVRLIIAVARMLVNGSDAVARVEIVEWLVKNGISKSDAETALRDFGLVKDKKQPVEDTTDKFFKSLASLGIDLRSEKLRSHGAYDFCEEAIRLFGIAGKVDGYMTFFLDAVLSKEIKLPFGLRDMIEWWEEEKGKLSVVVPENTNAVRVMTIHKSKGLEFPVVIYPFAVERVRHTKDRLWIDLEDPGLPGLNAALVNTGSNLKKTAFEKLYEEEAAKSELDLVNLLYVVMTRAGERLHIISESPPKSDGDCLSVPRLLKKFLSVKGLWSDDSRVYAFGDPETCKEKPVQQAAGYVMEDFYSNPWHEKIRLRMQYQDYRDDEGSRQWGKLIHRVLAEIDGEGDVENSVESLFLQGVIKKDESIRLSETIREFLAKPGIKRFFEPGLKVKKEWDILLPGGRSFRPDRVIEEDERLLVIDFKTGSKSPEHQKQLDHYRHILREMGYENVEGCLLYIYDDEPVVRI